jgi:poly-gamma-glutamate capsule biosynthesis protein CapA/YwtB (metallophosphatase superfamily)
MDKKERYRTMQWFVAGYLTGESAEPVDDHAKRNKNDG